MQNVTSLLSCTRRQLLPRFKHAHVLRTRPSARYIATPSPSSNSQQATDIPTNYIAKPPTAYAKWHEEWKSIPTRTLESKLQDYAQEQNKYEETVELAMYLCNKRAVPPSRKMYQALLTASVSTMGSISTVLYWIQEMRDLDIPLRETEYLILLRVLAVHPDYALRAEILSLLEKNWSAIGEVGRQFLIAGYARDRQLEKAVEEVRTMRKEGLLIRPWVYDLVVSTLCSAWEFEEAIKVMRMRHEDIGPEDASALWVYMLEQAANSGDYDTCKYIWKRQVKPEYINPNFGTSNMVLNIVAREGDVDLARDIIFHVRHWICVEHYEMLIEAMVNAGDIKSAFEVLSEMGSDKAPATSASTRPILQWFLDNPDQNPLEYLEHLRLLKLEQKYPPPESLNVLIEAAVKQYKTKHKDAIALYERCHFALKDGPNNVTFHHMFELSRKVGKLDLALELDREHSMMELKGDALFYDGLILACLVNANSSMDAYQFLLRMIREEVIPMPRTLRALYQVMCLSEDKDASRVLEEYRKVVKTEWEYQRLIEETTRDLARFKRGEKVEIYANEPLYDTLPNDGANDLAFYLESIKEVDFETSRESSDENDDQQDRLWSPNLNTQ